MNLYCKINRKFQLELTSCPGGPISPIPGGPIGPKSPLGPGGPGRPGGPGIYLTWGNAGIIPCRIESPSRPGSPFSP